MSSPCEPSPCGQNAECRENNLAGACFCFEGYFGDPYQGCRRECENDNDCSRNLACIKYKCSDPCPGVCGINAHCSVINHLPTCNCNDGKTGDPFVRCLDEPITPIPRQNPCSPSPCGPNSLCREHNGQATCSCASSFIGAPPNCRPECRENSECPSQLSCINQKCGDPCPNTCGINARCNVKNHSPVCTCMTGYRGDPFKQCLPICKKTLFLSLSS